MSTSNHLELSLTVIYQGVTLSVTHSWAQEIKRSCIQQVISSRPFWATGSIPHWQKFCEGTCRVKPYHRTTVLNIIMIPLTSRSRKNRKNNITFPNPSTRFRIKCRLPLSTTFKQVQVSNSANHVLHVSGLLHHCKSRSTIYEAYWIYKGGCRGGLLCICSRSGYFYAWRRRIRRHRTGSWFNNETELPFPWSFSLNYQARKRVSFPSATFSS